MYRRSEARWIHSPQKCIIGLHECNTGTHKLAYILHLASTTITTAKLGMCIHQDVGKSTLFVLYRLQYSSNWQVHCEVHLLKWKKFF